MPLQFSFPFSKTHPPDRNFRIYYKILQQFPIYSADPKSKLRNWNSQPRFSQRGNPIFPKFLRLSIRINPNSAYQNLYEPNRWKVQKKGRDKQRRWTVFRINRGYLEVSGKTDSIPRNEGDGKEPNESGYQSSSPLPQWKWWYNDLVLLRFVGFVHQLYLSCNEGVNDTLSQRSLVTTILCHTIKNKKKEWMIHDANLVYKSFDPK